RRHRGGEGRILTTSSEGHCSSQRRRTAEEPAPAGSAEQWHRRTVAVGSDVGEMGAEERAHSSEEQPASAAHQGDVTGPGQTVGRQQRLRRGGGSRDVPSSERWHQYWFADQVGQSPPVRSGANLAHAAPVAVRLKLRLSVREPGRKASGTTFNG